MNGPRRNRRGILAGALLAHALLVGIVPSAVLAAARSVEAVVAEKSQWSSFATAGTPMTIEGRISTISGRQMRFRNCDLPLQSHDGKNLTRPVAQFANAEVSGRFGLVNAKPTFLIERMRETPSDLDEFRRRARELGKGKPEDWYALGDWATARGAFYEDEDFQKRSREAYREAIAREHRALPPEAIEALVSLSEKIPKLGLPESLRAEFVHEAWHRRWKAVAKNDTTALRGLAESMAKDLAGCTTPLDPSQAKLNGNYLRDPLKVYREADETTRGRLHRVLYSQTLRTAILTQTRPDGSNGYAIAAELDALGPEFHELAETHREKELELRISRVKSATRQDVVQLADELRQRKRPEKARQILETWLKARAERLREDGPTGLIQAADDYESLIEDKQTAHDLLIEAYKIDPASVDISRRLKHLGYELKEGRWLARSEAQAVPDSPIRIALREGRVAAGMTADQVHKSLGAPVSVTRVASLNEVNELWTYENTGRIRLVVHIQRRGTGEARTVSVTQLKAAAP